MFGFVSVKVEGVDFKHQKQTLTVLQEKKKKPHKNQLIYVSDTGDSQQFQDVDGISLENGK